MKDEKEREYLANRFATLCKDYAFNVADLPWKDQNDWLLDKGRDFVDDVEIAVLTDWMLQVQSKLRKKSWERTGK